MREAVYELRQGGQIYAQGTLRNLGYDAATLRAMAAAGYILYRDGKRVARKELSA